MRDKHFDLLPLSGGDGLAHYRCAGQDKICKIVDPRGDCGADHHQWSSSVIIFATSILLKSHCRLNLTYPLSGGANAYQRPRRLRDAPDKTLASISSSVTPLVSGIKARPARSVTTHIAVKKLKTITDPKACTALRK